MRNSVYITGAKLIKETEHNKLSVLPGTEGMRIATVKTTLFATGDKLTFSASTGMVTGTDGMIIIDESTSNASHFEGQSITILNHNFGYGTDFSRRCWCSCDGQCVSALPTTRADI